MGVFFSILGWILGGFWGGFFGGFLGGFFGGFLGGFLGGFWKKNGKKISPNQPHLSNPNQVSTKKKGSEKSKISPQNRALQVERKTEVDCNAYFGFYNTPKAASSKMKVVISVTPEVGLDRWG